MTRSLGPEDPPHAPADCACQSGASAEDSTPAILLSQAKVGTDLVISGVLGGRKIARDLNDLGLRVGHSVKVLRRLIGGGVAVRYSTMTVAIGSTLARQVMVRPTCPL